ncbi:MAG: multicopper oxidase family protein, partial [Mycobacterium sp.]
MPTRRDLLRTGLMAGGAALAPRAAGAQLCAPQNDPNLPVPASPSVVPFSVSLPIPETLQPVESLDPPPDPSAHQRYDEFAPVKLYEIHVAQTPHPFARNYDPSDIFGYNGVYPGPTIPARWGEPILVRIYNDLPVDAVGFGLPSITTHLHNMHSASESDGGPPDFHGPGTYHDHHYAMHPAGGDPREIMNTLWYHDHRQDFTAANVVRGLAAFFLAFDGLDSGDETDTNAEALRLPSGEFDVPLVFVDRVFDRDGVQTFDTFNTDGTLGDRFGVNGTIQPFFPVRRRKYRLRLLNAGPSRFYQFFLSSGQPFIQLSTDGNLLPAPIVANSIFLSVAERVDVIVDFSNARLGDQIFLV